MNQSPGNYFKELAECFEHTVVTDARGHRLSLEQGAGRAVEMILSLGSESQKHKAMIIGNGGSAAIASHIQNDLCKAVGIQALVFNEASLLTALTNDMSYQEAFEELVKLWAVEKDLLIAISSSGKSQNILRAAQMAHVKKCSVITFSGFEANNPLRTLGDLNFYVPNRSYGLVEISHMALAHYVTDCAMAMIPSQSGKTL